MKEFMSLKPGVQGAELPKELQDDRPVLKVTSECCKITIEYTFPGFFLFEEIREIENRKPKVFHQINITKTGHLGKSGKPLLPLLGRYVQIPHNVTYDISADILTKKTIPKKIRVLPAQQGMTEAPEYREELLEFDDAFYKRDELYPEKIFRIRGPFDIDGYRALLVQVYPFQFNPAKKRLFGYQNIRVTIKLQADQRAKRRLAMGSPITKEAFGNLFLNPQRTIEPGLGLEPRKAFYRSTGTEYLIIHAKIFKDAAASLAEWKNRRGLITEMISIDTIGNETGKIKEYLRREREKPNSRLRYVLLLGDVNTIVPERIGNITSDYYYSTPPEDALVDESSSDKPQLVLPWLAIGRIPVEKDDDAESVVQQIINYEKDPPGDRSYFRRMVVAASFEEQDPAERRVGQPGKPRRYVRQPDHGVDDRAFLKTIEEIRRFAVGLGYKPRRVYVKNDEECVPRYHRDGTLMPAGVKRAFVTQTEATKMLIDATTEGQLIIAHRDHASPQGWSNPPFTIEHLRQVTGGMPSIFFSINCSTGRFDAREECFAEKLLRMKGAAPSLIAATHDTYTWLNNDLIRALFDALFGGFLPTYPGTTASLPMKFGRLGDLLIYAKAYLLTVATDVHRVKYLLEAAHVLGDPALEIWKDGPRKVGLKAVIKSGTLDVRLSHCPQGAVITVWYEKEMVKRLEPSSTHFTISLQGGPFTQAGRPVDICFWASGYRYTEQRIHLP